LLKVLKINRLIFALALIAAVCIDSLAYAQPITVDRVSALPSIIAGAKQSALVAQQDCIRYVQMNVFEFEECINKRLNAKGLTSAERLGITYMGFVGALSGQRMGSQGSHRMSWEFANKIQKMQKKLGLNDNDLCPIIPGDCQMRIARAQLILKQSAPAPITESELAGVHKH
jgi:hypothetical protein